MGKKEKNRVNKKQIAAGEFTLNEMKRVLLRNGNQILRKRFEGLLIDMVWTSQKDMITLSDFNNDEHPDLVIGGEDGKLKM
ncbi:MAG: hypothetical protein KAS70_06305 [Planctomycetes bacterium]|nr:hypothetical protein [Planctomycetota bacterium]MCK5578245.1 hypothetical protein [Planctomycetota bacterium]